MASFMGSEPSQQQLQGGGAGYGACGGQQMYGQGAYNGNGCGQQQYMQQMPQVPYPQQMSHDAYGGGAGGSGFNGAGGMSQGYGWQGNSEKGGRFNGGCNGMQNSYDGGYGGFDGGSYGDDWGGEDGYGFGWKPEYSQGTGPEYEAEALWSAEADEEFAEVHVFGPSGEQVPSAVTTFQQAQQIFPPQIVNRLMEAGFTAPTPIQAHTWAIGVAGRDLIGIAKTGSGKTLAFLMPGFLKISSNRMRGVQICILAPTRELACQIEEEAEKFGRIAGIRTACCYGGAPRGPQLGALRRGAQIVVACPGRLNDFIQSGAVNLSMVNYLVLDEADRMLDMGFEPQIRQVIRELPEERQTLLFTATWPKEVRSLASEFLKRPIHVQTGAQNEMTVNKDIAQHVCFCANEQEKAQKLLEILSLLGREDRALIFCEMKRSCEILANDLIHYHGVPACRLHGDMAQYERTSALEAFKNGRRPILCATDVCARGIDVKGVTCVINYDASSSAKDYVHRIGRTGRAGQRGTAYTLLLQSEEKKAIEIIQVLQRSNVPIPPELEHLAARRSGKGKGKGKGGKGKGGKGGKGGKSSGKGKGGGKGKGFGSGGKGKSDGPPQF
eukprot:TRINITY_DN63093_c0_g1_i1.p1 TRINITY_DN63093_c0_g1~~TRINITY_DN63093_c0_g1_i1.p1  ORF type:complete len:610 (-),score=120.50 TRINITY_DN63093_c0_g1_i1:76-1905(-)